MTSPNAQELADYLTARHIPGIIITPTTLTIAETPEKYPGHGQTIPGIHFTIGTDANDRNALDSPELGIELLSALHHLYPTQFQLEKASTILAQPGNPRRHPFRRRPPHHRRHLGRSAPRNSAPTPPPTSSTAKAAGQPSHQTRNVNRMLI